MVYENRGTCRFASSQGVLGYRLDVLISIGDATPTAPSMLGPTFAPKSGSSIPTAAFLGRRAGNTAQFGRPPEHARPGNCLSP